MGIYSPGRPKKFNPTTGEGRTPPLLHQENIVFEMKKERLFMLEKQAI